MIFQNTNRVPYFCRFHLYARKLGPSLANSNHNNNDTSPSKRITTSSSNSRLAHLRVLCVSEEARAVNPLEIQEDFVEIARSGEMVEIYDKSEIEVRFSGNLLCRAEKDNSLCSAVINSCLNDDIHIHSTTSDGEDEFVNCDSKKLVFRPFCDNRIGFEIKRRNEKNLFPRGNVSFVTVSSDKVVYETKLDLSRFM